MYCRRFYGTFQMSLLSYFVVIDRNITVVIIQETSHFDLSTKDQLEFHTVQIRLDKYFDPILQERIMSSKNKIGLHGQRNFYDFKTKGVAHYLLI